MKCFVIPKATDANIILRMGSLSSAPYSTFHWYFKKLFILSLSLRGDTFFWALDHAEVLLYGSYGGACHSFHLFSHGNCNPVHLSWISHIHYRTMLVVIPFFSLLQSEKKSLPLLIKIGFDHIWEMQWRNKRKYQDLFHTGVELASAWWYLWGHWYLVTCCLPRV